MHIVLDRELFKTTKAIKATKAIKTVVPTWLASKKQLKVQSSIFVQNNEKKTNFIIISKLVYPQEQEQQHSNS